MQKEKPSMTILVVTLFATAGLLILFGIVFPPLWIVALLLIVLGFLLPIANCINNIRKKYYE